MKTIFIGIGFAVLGFVIGGAIATYILINRYNVQDNNNILHQVRADMDLVNFIELNRANYAAVNKKLNEIIVTDLYLISIKRPSINSLNATSLDTLCRAIKLDHEKRLSFGGDQMVANQVSSYLEAIRSDVSTSMSRQLLAAGNPLTQNAMRKFGIVKEGGMGITENSSLLCDN